MVLLVTHAWWLKAFGEFLVLEKPFSRADAALVLGGDHRLQRATELLATEVVSQIWLVEQEPRYPVEAGILPAPHDIESEQLKTLGVSAEQIRVLEGQADEYEHVAEILADHLSNRPDVRVVIVCERLHGRNVRTVFSEVMGSQMVDRIDVLGLPADEFNERNWWRSRTGWKSTFTAVTDLMFTYFVGVQPGQARPEFDVDTYEGELVSRFAEASCHGE